MTTAALLRECNLPVWVEQIDPPSSVAYATVFPPKGKPWNKTRFMAYNYLNSEKSKAFF